jgi:K+-sensing histidine kinase KdpD
VPKTITFVTNQYSCDRIIRAARTVADDTETDLVVVGILDSEYELNPEVVDYLFELSKKNRAVMRLIFTEDKMQVMREMIGGHDCHNVVTGMPSNNQSVLYQLWKSYPQKAFHTVAETGEVLEVASSLCFRTA